MSGQDTYIAKPSGDCCLKGTIHSGKPRGSFTTITDIETYVVRPQHDNDTGNVIFYFPDVWGLFVNGLLVCDAFADAGYHVLALDYFRGVSSIVFMACGHTYDVCVRIR